MTSHTHLSRRQFIRGVALAAGSTALGWDALAASIREPARSDFPVVIIGAGLGGLISGAYLARAGFPVTVLEQHAVPGGYASAFDRGDFTFDVSLHATVVEGAVPQKILTELGLWDRIELAHAPELRRIVADGYDVTLPARDPDGVKAALSQAFPTERQGIHGFYSEMVQVIEEMNQGRRSSNSMMQQLSKISLAQWMDRQVSRPEVKACMSVFSGYYGVEPDRINALFYAIATGEYLVHGGQYYKSRSQDFSDLLAGAIEGGGGQMVYNTRAREIRRDKKGAVTAVVDDRGIAHPARAVVANCPVPTLVGELLPRQAFSRDFLTAVDRRNPSLASFIVWLGLDRPVSGIGDYEIDFLGDGRLIPGRRPGQGDPARAKFSLNLYDNLYPDYSAPGKSTLSLVCLADYAPWKRYEADYFQGRKAAYNKEKDRIAEALVRRVEKQLIFGLSERIEVMEAATPLTNVFYTGNPGGAIYGYDRDLPPLGVKTPVPGLYLAGSWANGGGYTPAMMGGREAAGALIRDFRRSAG